MKNRQTWLRTLVVGLIGGGAASLYPSRSTVCPAWTIQVVDTAGYVSFPERTVRSSWLARTFGIISNTMSLGVHASYGPSAYVLAYGHTVGGKRLEGSANYQAGEPLAAKLVTRVSDLHLK